MTYTCSKFARQYEETMLGEHVRVDDKTAQKYPYWFLGMRCKEIRKTVTSKARTDDFLQWCFVVKKDEWFLDHRVYQEAEDAGLDVIDISAYTSKGRQALRGSLATHPRLLVVVTAELRRCALPPIGSNLYFGSMIRAARQKEGITITRLAKCMGMSCLSLAAIERGVSPPLRGERLRKLSKELRINHQEAAAWASSWEGYAILPYETSRWHAKVGSLLMGLWDDLDDKELVALQAVLLGVSQRLSTDQHEWDDT